MYPTCKYDGCTSITFSVLVCCSWFYVAIAMSDADALRLGIILLYLVLLLLLLLLLLVMMLLMFMLEFTTCDKYELLYGDNIFLSI